MHFRLEVNGYTQVEVAALREIASVDTLVEHAVACRELGIGAGVLRHGEDVVHFAPNGKALQPAELNGELVGEAHLLELQE